MQWTLAIFGLALVLIAQDVTAQLTYPDTEVCTAPNRQTGTCINIKSCPPLLALVRQQPLTPETIETLQKSQCGFDGNDPKVCCTASNNQPTPPTPLNDDQPPDVSNHPNLRLLDHDICGPINVNKIIGGNSTGVNEFPWMALLAYRKSGKNPEYRCGGTILNKRYILTAAHCVTNLPSGWWLTGIRVGEHDIRTERDCDKAGTFEEVCAEKYQDFGFESTLFHPGYSIKTLHNDIALIRLNRDIDFRPDNAKPICMPLGSAARIRSKKLLVSGWGITETTLASPVLLKAAMPIYPQDQCVDVYKLQTQIWHKQICVGGERNIDSCRGDSGGPLQGPTVYNGNSRYVQYGVVSFGVRRCGTLGFPGVYTRVDYYLDWILDNIRD